MFYSDQYIHIDVLFKSMSPELLVQNISSSARMHEHFSFYISSNEVSERLYCHCARGLSSNTLRTEDEIIQRFRDLKQYLNRKPKGGILSLLSLYTSETLRFRDAEPQLRQEYVMEWRERTHALGQDLFTCAGLADEDIKNHRSSRYFSWPSAVSSDHIMMRRMLARGMSENHFHLNGSTQIFPLAWSFLMNYPKKVRQYFSSPLFQENLSSSISFGTSDNKWDWTSQIYLAIWLRAYLFRKVSYPLCLAHTKDEKEIVENNSQGTDSLLLSPFQEFLLFLDSVEKLQTLSNKIEPLRMFSYRLQRATNNSSCLDYAIVPEIAKNNGGANRLLAGERYFLYLCFCRCYDGTFSQEMMDLFYLYLLIKIKFRAELVQCNNRPGFRNFSDYQDRKSVLWGDRGDYWEEAYRLSIASAFEREEQGKPLMQSLEMRIMPKPTALSLFSSIREIDFLAEKMLSQKPLEMLGPSTPPQSANFPRPEFIRAQDEANYFYVLHFAKEPLEILYDSQNPPEHLSSRYLNIQKAKGKPRNHRVRHMVELQAKATAKALARSSYLCSRIRGIDAASHEIGCRPETFATAYRYLRQFSPSASFTIPTEGTSGEVRYWPRLSATYHVGEDFLDLADGLRAIDEAICYLNLERGDRLGHALALGVLPKQYYRIKENYIYLPKQDLLDNIVWLLFRTLEWNIPMSSELRSIQIRGEELFREIYGEVAINEGYQNGYIEFTLADYYQSWKLRGDDPSLYIGYSGEAIKNCLKDTQHSWGSMNGEYERAKIDHQLWDYNHTSYEKDIEETDFSIRNSRKIQLLLYYYHYGLKERKCGQAITRYDVQEEYIQVIYDIQELLIRKIMNKGISIECNPSSNKMIGTFDKYDHHPIFRFNNYGLALPEYPSPKSQLTVSVNTDDQGIFDTSLENEFTLLYACLQMRKTSDGTCLITDDAIHSYLDHLRRMGNDITFPKSEKYQRRKK